MTYVAVLRLVFGQLRYSVGAIGIALMILSAILLLPHSAILAQVFSSDQVSLWEKMNFLFSLYGTLGTSFSGYSGAVLLLTAGLFGINLALLIFYIRQRKRNVGVGHTASLVSLGGTVSALFGVGCAACGSVILTSVFGLLGAGAFLAILPFHGAEFGVLGVVLLIVSIGFLMKKLTDPLVCLVD